jgi:hypothetical protein
LEDGTAFVPELTQQALDPTFRERGKNLAEFGKRCPLRCVFPQMFFEQRLVGFAIESSSTRVGPLLPETGIEAAGKQVTHTTTAAQAFNRTNIDQSWETTSHRVRQRSIPGDGIEREKVIGRKAAQLLLTESLQESNEGWILH